LLFRGVGTGGWAAPGCVQGVDDWSDFRVSVRSGSDLRVGLWVSRFWQVCWRIKIGFNGHPLPRQGDLVSWLKGETGRVGVWSDAGVCVGWNEAVLRKVRFEWILGRFSVFLRFADGLCLAICDSKRRGGFGMVLEEMGTKKDFVGDVCRFWFG
jgi:hypothetical protein